MSKNDPWFRSIEATPALSTAELHALREDGFVVTPGPVANADLAALSRAYDLAVAVTVVCPPDKWVARSPRRRALRHWSLRHSPVSKSAALVVDTVDRGSGVRVS